MCGVFFSNSKISIKSKVISDSLLRRGPDDSQILREKDYIVQFTRLAIRDLVNGGQPYISNDANFISAVNGELYNEDYIKNYLLVEKCSVPSGDMQVLSEFLIKDISNIKYVEGAYAGFIYDKVRKKIVFFRDPTGEKPLYYFNASGAITISSTIRSIVDVFGRGSFQLNTKGLYKGHSDPGATIFSEIREVLPGHYIECDLESNISRVTKYFEWPVRRPHYNNAKRLKDNFSQTLVNAVSRTSISDVPVCMLLSSGLDSAAVLAARNELGNSKISSFTLAFENESYDESRLSSLTAKYLGSNHNIIRVSNYEFAKDISVMLKSLDSPILDPAYLPMYVLTKRIKNQFGFKVAFTGDGGDELFRGYELYKVRKRVNFANTRPFTLNARAIIELLGILSVASDKRSSMSSLLARLNTVLCFKEIVWNETALSPFAGTKLFACLLPSGPKIQANGKVLRKISSKQIENYYHNEILPQVYLKKSDNSSMANGVELRIPYLHKSMIDFAYEIPEEMFESKPHKWLLREYLDKKVPLEILNQPKRGFSVPLSGILSNIPKPKWKLESINLCSDLCDSVWHKACNGDLNSARAGYAIMVLNSYLQRSN